MSISTEGQASVCHVLREDIGLAEVVEPSHRARAVFDCTAPCVRVTPGRWRHGSQLGDPHGLGLLVLEGLLIRKVGVDKRFGAELLGEGDLLRPWQEDVEPPTLLATSDWRVLEATRVAVLDESFTRMLGRYPRLGGCLMSRAVQRSRHLAVNMAIVHQARVDVRLHMVFWHLAARWGRVRSDGVAVPIRLTHTVLADLVAARRPTVTTALTELARQGVVRPVTDGWLLVGGPPGEFVSIGHPSAQALN